jgi:N-acetylmuramoyl-L-alanine amidase
MFANWKLLTGLALVVCLPLAARAQSQKADQAREQFERAVALRTELESRPQDQRTLPAYQKAVQAYKKVSAIGPQSEEVTPSLMATAELYRDMGHLYDTEYFTTAIDTYNSLLKDYPHSRFAPTALTAIGHIQQQDLNDYDGAETTFKDVIRRFPKSPKAVEAKNDLNRLAETREAELSPRAPLPLPVPSAGPSTAKVNPASADSGALALVPPSGPPTGPMEPKEGGHEAGIAKVSAVRTWNAENYTRVVVELGDSVHFQAGKLHTPERLFFDLTQAHVDASFGSKTIDVSNGFLKTVRVAQNKANVVRLVFDIDKAKSYSAFLLEGPYRLVIDVHGDSQPQFAGKRNSSGDAVGTKLAADVKPSSTRSVGADGPSNAASLGPQPVERLPIYNNGTKSVGTPSAATGPKPTRDGQRSLTRVLGLKISRIVIDAGHGGYDTGTIGPHGLMEKDLCLDVALRLGRLIQERLPAAEVTYTRKDDTFIPLEERTAIANQVKADLFVSIHANSSHDQDARGVETYYLNFATSQDAMDVAARENAQSQEGIHDLQNMIQKIARNEKVEESRELAGDIQDSLTKRLQQISRSERDRGVKKAPFVVLIGANMPSVLAEISFLSNPSDEKMLKKPDQRERIAEGLYRGMSSYLENLNSLSYNQPRALASHVPAPLDSAGNQK